MGTCFLVLGTTRSGTSVTAGLLHRLGVVMGWELIPERGQTERYDWPDAWQMNPEGFYQDAPVENVQDAIWGDDYPLEGTRPPASAGRHVEEFKKLIRMRCRRGHARWGMKASRTPWMMPEFFAACTDDVKFVVTKRNPDASARSLHHWFNNYSPQQCAEWVRRSNQQIADTLTAYPDALRFVVEFDDLFDRKEETLNALAAFVGVPLNERATSFVNPSLRRVR